MARIAIAWEMGGELGHAMACAMLARALTQRGHRIAFMFRELRQLAALADADRYEVFQAPMSHFDSHGAGASYSMADILLGCGYDDPGQLTGLLGGWVALLGRWGAEMVIADSAPTALLAARVRGLPRVSYGNGFSIPPHLTPLPAFRVDAAMDPSHLARSDARATQVANAALGALGAPPIGSLSEVFATDEDFLCTFPELDHYGARPPAAYWGPRVSVDAGEAVRWPPHEGPRVIVYLRRALPQLDALIDALAASPCRVAAYIPELDADRRARLQGARRIVSERPLRLKPLLEGCELFVSHGGNVAPGALMAGVPQLVFPAQYEQFLTALRIAQAGCGSWLGPGAKPGEVGPALRRLLEDPRYAGAARAFARRYAAFSPAEQQRRIVARIEDILSRSSTSQGERQ